MKLAFTKMHGLGNDFVVFDAIHHNPELNPEQIRFIADRHFGVGCDQILLVEAPRSDDTDFYYRIFNADGSEVEQCGNGARCFARFVHEKGLFQGDVIRVGTAKGDIRLYLLDNGLVKVNMGIPELQPALIPFQAEAAHPSYPLELDQRHVEISAVSLGNPHAVLLSDDPARDVQQLGPQIESHPRFPQRVNAGFMKIIAADEIELRVYERGAGETLACGSGACAAVVAGRLLNRLQEQVKVHLRGGDLIIRWQDQGKPVWMSGPATTVFEGILEL